MRLDATTIKLLNAAGTWLLIMMPMLKWWLRVVTSNRRL